MSQSPGLAGQLELRGRTARFAVLVSGLGSSLPGSIEGRRITDQLVRCSTSVAANYRAACRAKSRRDFIAKIGIVLEEADESQYWLSHAKARGLLSGAQLESAVEEARQLVAIFTATRATARRNARKT